MEFLNPIYELVYALEMKGKRIRGYDLMDDETLWKYVRTAYPDECRQYPDLVKRIGLYLCFGEHFANTKDIFKEVNHVRRSV